MAVVDLERRAEIGREKRARTRERLIAAAAEEWRALTRDEKISIDGFVAAAGVAKGTFYVHFEDIDALWAELAERLARDYDELLQPRRLSLREPLERVAYGCAAFLEKGRRNPLWAAMTARAALGGPTSPPRRARGCSRILLPCCRSRPSRDCGQNLPPRSSQASCCAPPRCWRATRQRRWTPQSAQFCGPSALRQRRRRRRLQRPADHARADVAAQDQATSGLGGVIHGDQHHAFRTRGARLMGRCARRRRRAAFRRLSDHCSVDRRRGRGLARRARRAKQTQTRRPARARADHDALPYLLHGANYRQHMIPFRARPGHEDIQLFFTKSDASIASAVGLAKRPAHVKLLDYEIELALVFRRAIDAPVTIKSADLPNYVSRSLSPMTSALATCSCRRHSSTRARATEAFCRSALGRPCSARTNLEWSTNLT